MIWSPDALAATEPAAPAHRGKIAGVDPDLALLAQWRAGDQHAGEDLFGRHFEDLYRLLEHRAGAEADDLARRAFLACLQDTDGERRPSSFRAYLFGMARRELFRDARRLELDEPVDFATASAAGDPAPVHAPVHAIDSDAGRTRAALRQLPVAQQLLLELHAWHGMDDAVIAEVLEVPVDEVPMKLERARAALQRALQG
jgi:RNA polymerase sigma factor (sigma-70 family)